jgi:hypothetical protein
MSETLNLYLWSTGRTEASRLVFGRDPSNGRGQPVVRLEGQCADALLSVLSDGKRIAL